MRRWLWALAAVLLPLGAAVVVSTDSEWVTAVLSIALWGAIAVGFAIRIARSARTGRSAKRALTPATDAAEDVQAMFLGRRPRQPVVYGQDDPVVPTLFDADAPDPLSDPNWTVAPPPPTDRLPEDRTGPSGS